ncbi:hypothetical protein [Herbaspirillum robiniae]
MKLQLVLVAILMALAHVRADATDIGGEEGRQAHGADDGAVLLPLPCMMY